MDVALPFRVGLELLLYGAAALGLIATGFAVCGVALIVSEVVVTCALALLGYPPADARTPAEPLPAGE